MSHFKIDATGKNDKQHLGIGASGNAAFLTSREDDDPLKKKNEYLFANLGNMLNGSMQLPGHQA